MKYMKFTDIEGMKRGKTCLEHYTYVLHQLEISGILPREFWIRLQR